MLEFYFVRDTYKGTSFAVSIDKLEEFLAEDTDISSIENTEDRKYEIERKYSIQKVVTDNYEELV